MIKISKLYAVLAAMLLLTACATKTAVETPAAEDTGVSTGAPITEAAEVSAMPAQPELAVDPLSDPNSPLAKRVIYFDFDSATIKPEYRAVVEAHANYIAQHPEVKVGLEGHTDERGSREYNIGLGDRRAQSISQAMALLGANSKQIRIVSYGEERPAADGHDEGAWSKNRRVVIVY